MHHAARLSRQLPAQLNVGFGISAFKEAAEFVSRLQRTLPDVQVSLDDFPSQVMTEKLLSGELDIAFMRLPLPENTVHCPEAVAFKQETLSLAVPAGTVVQPGQELSLITRNPLLTLHENRGAGLYHQITAFLDANHVTPQAVHYSSDIRTLIALVAAGAGVALLPGEAGDPGHPAAGRLPDHVFGAGSGQRRRGRIREAGQDDGHGSLRRLCERGAAQPDPGKGRALLAGCGKRP